MVCNLTYDEIRTLAEAYHVSELTQEDYISFLNDLEKLGVLSSSDMNKVVVAPINEIFERMERAGV